MKPIEQFQSVWERAEELSVLHLYLSENVSGAIRKDELLRAEWAMRVSALDLYIHELTIQQMIEIFIGVRSPSAGYLRFRVSMETLRRVSDAPLESVEAFELDVRGQLSLQSFQDPDKIADAIRLCCDLELWNQIAIHLGAPPADKVKQGRLLKKSLSAIVQRRHKIVHEGDMQPGFPRTAWPISRTDLQEVKLVIWQVVSAIDALVQ